MILCITVRDAIPFITPFIAFALGLWAAGILDRRRALYAVRGRIQSAIDDVSIQKVDFYAAHKSGIESIKEPVFGALPWLSKEKQDQVLKVWSNFRQIPLHDFSATGSQFTISKSAGTVQKVKTQSEAIIESLRALDATIR